MSVAITTANNYDVETVRQALSNLFKMLDLPAENPLGSIINKGDTVFIKPNWVAHRYRASCDLQHDVYTTITHPVVIKEVAKYVDLALDGDGKIIIGDNPSIDADFPTLMELFRPDELIRELKTPTEVLDLRPLVCKDLKDYGNRDKMHEQLGDPRGIERVNLGEKSKLYGLKSDLFRGVFDQREETIRAHTGDVHKYGLSRSIYDADVFISVPKLKTHHKTGVTLNLKGLVGTIGRKNDLVHWRNGYPEAGGDAYPSKEAMLKDEKMAVKNRGAWNGNDTIWRMVADLYSCFKMKENQKRFSIVDGILAGQQEGPFCPSPKDAHVLLAGTDFLETDAVATRLMGFDVKEVPVLAHCMMDENMDETKISIAEDIGLADFWSASAENLDFKPPQKWSNLTGGRK